MPTYEYLCESCGYKFERFQKMSDAPIKECPQCGKEVKRIIGAGMGVIFKGSGSIKTCCGRTERCDKPPCLDTGECKR
ncbi:MAG: zinc ribbon domain-containing protein [Candidatus Omnitrophota bacterium]|nr:zinc ribbon domain-containing protein [Candidatus Omnitrophota bacterium]